MKIRNFQSLRSVDLEVEGFTVVTGSSNVGKSAVVRAVSAAIFGELGDYYISDRPEPIADQCAVGIIEKNSYVKWWKVRDGKATPQRSTSLEVWDGTKKNTYTKFGKDQAELTKDLGFLTIRVSEKEVCPQIAMQLDEIFLLQRSETEAAEVLKLLGRVDVVTEAQRLATKDAREAAGKLKVRGTDQLTAKIRLEAMEWVKQKRREFNRLMGKMSHILTAQMIREDWLRIIKTVRAVKMRKVPEKVSFALPIGYLNLIGKLRELRKLGKKEIPNQRGEIGIPKIKIELRKKIEEARILINEHASAWIAASHLGRDIDSYKNAKIAMEKELGKCPTCERIF